MVWQKWCDRNKVGSSGIQLVDRSARGESHRATMQRMPGTLVLCLSSRHERIWYRAFRAGTRESGIVPSEQARENLRMPLMAVRFCQPHEIQKNHKVRREGMGRERVRRQNRRLFTRYSRIAKYI